MDSHFDPTQYHPSFGESEIGHTPFEISMDSFLQRIHEYGLPDDVVYQAAHNAWDFFSMVHIPIEIGQTTCIETGNPFTYDDDKLTISTDRLKNLGIHDLNSLSLICTHEAMHQITQNLYAHGQISDWQSELLSDKWMGIRAAMQEIDPSSVIESIQKETDSPSHPGGDLRVKHFEEGYNLVKQLNDSEIPLTFDNLMDRAVSQINSDETIISREIYAKSHEVSHFVPQQKAYTQSEIDNHIREEQSKIDHLKSIIADKSRAMANKAAADEACDSEKYSIGSAKIDLEKAIKSKNFWENAKASK